MRRGRSVSSSRPSTFAARPSSPRLFASFRAGGADAVNILASPLASGFRGELGELSVTYKLRAIGQSREMAEAGCLASYGIGLSEAFSVAANLTDKVLKGARPAETPAEQPTKFQLVINQRTARAIGVEIPQQILARADEVIE
jgi:putative ABC transport system substrate-binding protein